MCQVKRPARFNIQQRQRQRQRQPRQDKKDAAAAAATGCRGHASCSLLLLALLTVVSLQEFLTTNLNLQTCLRERDNRLAENKGAKVVVIRVALAARVCVCVC